MDGLSAPAGQFSPKGYIGYSDNLKPDSYDLDRAKELMAEAGYADGFKLTMHGPAGRYSNDTRILEAIAQMLSRLGIDTSVETMPASVWVIVGACICLILNLIGLISYQRLITICTDLSTSSRSTAHT